MDTIEVKNAFEELLSELKACTEKAAFMRDAVTEAHRLLERYPQPANTDNARLLATIKEIIRSASEKP